MARPAPTIFWTWAVGWAAAPVYELAAAAEELAGAGAALVGAELGWDEAAMELATLGCTEPTPPLDQGRDDGAAGTLEPAEAGALDLAGTEATGALEAGTEAAGALEVNGTDDATGAELAAAGVVSAADDDHALQSAHSPPGPGAAIARVARANASVKRIVTEHFAPETPSSALINQEVDAIPRLANRGLSNLSLSELNSVVRKRKLVEACEATPGLAVFRVWTAFSACLRTSPNCTPKRLVHLAVREMIRTAGLFGFKLRHCHTVQLTFDRATATEKNDDVRFPHLVHPRTYLAKKRLDEALRRFRSSGQKDAVNFTVTYFPYQLNPEATKVGEDKYEWYKKSRYGDSKEKMSMYVTLMSAYGQSAGINYKFGGTVANTIDAHRVIQHFQEKKGPEVADKIINSLYSQYFENEKHPSSDLTLLTATTAAGIPESEARTFIDDRDDGLFDVKNKIQEQAHNGVDSVPYIVLEGKRRDITLIGAKEVEEYEKALAQIVKESD
ncbi:hypothetical protein DV736_g5067, partial [Chaetothyriales sp. CBS 134916]